MKKRLKLLLMTGVISLSAIGTVQFIYAEDKAEETNIQVENENANTSDSGNDNPGDSGSGGDAGNTDPGDSGSGNVDPGDSGSGGDTGNTNPGDSGSGNVDPGDGGSGGDAGNTDPGDSGSGSGDSGNDNPGDNGGAGSGDTGAGDNGGNSTEPAETEPAQTEPSTEPPTETESETTTETNAPTENNRDRNNRDEIDEDAARRYEEATGESIYVFGSYPVGDITENTNQIYDYLRNVLGLNHAAACGVLANIQCESNFATSAVGDGGTSYGLCQWHLGRFSALINWCNANGYEYHSIQGQMGYLTSELQGGYASVYQYLLSVPDTAQGAYDAAYYWCKYFEIPANLEYNSQMRADLAMNLYYPKTLGTQKEEKETEPEIVTLDENQMEQVMETVPESIIRLGRLDVSQEDTISQVLNNASAKNAADTSFVDMQELKKEAQKAVEQALSEYQAKNAAEKGTEQKSEQTLEELPPEKLAILENRMIEK